MPPTSHDVVWPIPVDPTRQAGPSRAQARGAGYRRTSRGLFVPAHVDADRPEQRICEAAALVPTFGGVTGWGALRWSGGVWFAGTAAGGALPRPVTLALGGKNIAARPGVLLSQERLGRDEVVEVDGLRMVNVVRALAFECRYATSVWAAVQAVDMAAYSDLVSIVELVQLVSIMNGWTGIERLRKALALADENSWSPRETWLRLVWILVAGLQPPLCNVPVFDRDGQHLGTPDLIDPQIGLIGEYDGSLHLAGSQRNRDVTRMERLNAAGLEAVVVVAGQDDVSVAQRLVAGQERAIRRTTQTPVPAWTLERPAWWVDTDTVAQRRALDDAERERWLRLRLRTS